jgi:hypothetical protein
VGTMKDMSDQGRLLSSPPAEKRLARQRQIALFTASAAVVAILVWAVLSGRGNTTQHNHSPLTDHEYAVALDLARQEIGRDDATVTSATVTLGHGTVTDSNIGYACTSGRLLHILLIGDYPHIVTTGNPVMAGSTEDFTVHAVVLTADAESGRACLLGVRTSAVAPEPGAISLPVG